MPALNSSVEPSICQVITFAGQLADPFEIASIPIRYHHTGFVEL